MPGITELDLETLPPAEMGTLLRSWIGEHAAELTEAMIDEQAPVEVAYAPPRAFQRMLFDAGWLRVGWPRDMGGLGGSAVLRAQVYEDLCAAGYTLPETVPTLEVLVPALMRYAPHLAEQFVPGLLRGEEVWAQGFSETEAGSDLASLRTKATAVEGGWRVSGHKVWSSFAVVSVRCMLIARTGDPAGRHRTLSMLLVDLDAPGVTVRPIRAMTGRDELAEIYFDDVFVPADRVVGPVDAGWEVAMFLLQWERGMYAWMRQAWVHNKLGALVTGDWDRAHDRDLGAAYLRALSLRLKARQTLRRLAAGENPGPEISVDKLLLSSAEQASLNLARTVLRGDFELSEARDMRHWAAEYFYTRASSIYGGAADIQRDIVAQRVLGLPRGR
jgi:alkylation response protein AidB-like acyl-CoA dehydrogenase